MENTPSPAIMRMDDLAIYLGISRPTIYRWRMQGALDPITHLDPGGRPYFLADEVNDWLRRRDLALSEIDGVTPEQWVRRMAGTEVA